MKKIFFVLAIVANTITFAQKNKNTTTNWSSDRPDGHAPIGVMADHTHHKGEFMISYRFMNMGMLRLKSDNQSATNFSNYMVVPQNMIMNMHMLGAMYAPSNRLTFIAMANYIQNNMNLQMIMMNGGMGMNMEMTKDFNTSSSGFGDVFLSALYSIFNNNRKSLHANLGIAIPTGKIDAKDTTPMSMGNDVQLPYPMQLGTGSWGTKVGFTYLWQNNINSFGAQVNSHINLNDNSQKYKFGNRYQATTWIAAKATDWLSASLRINGQLIDKIDGKSELLNSMMVTTANTKNSGGFYLHYGFGINLMQPKGTLKGLRLGAEIQLPLYQNVNGVQLDRSHTAIIGLQYAFH